MDRFPFYPSLLVLTVPYRTVPNSKKGQNFQTHAAGHEV